MRIIGVIDLKNGQAVHARGGRRDEYRPVARAGSVPVDGAPLQLARVYRDTFGLDEIYIADLDAIASIRPDTDAVSAISDLGMSVMVDAGISTADAAERAIRCGAGTVIVGLETLRSFEALAEIAHVTSGNVVFSLDLRDGTPLGSFGTESPESLAVQAVAAGTSAVIALDLVRVGGAAGPDLQMLRRILGAIPGTAVLAGGGVRNRDDLTRLAEIGCAGALVASALHDGRLTRADLAAAKSG